MLELVLVPVAMMSFCFTYPFGIMVLVGGLVGKLTAGSNASLIAGGITGLAYLFTAYSQHQSYLGCKMGKVLPGNYTANAKKNNIIALIVSCILSLSMSRRYLKTGKLMPAGMVAFLALGMAVFLGSRLISPLDAPKVVREEEL